MWNYEIYLHDELVDQTKLRGIAFLKFESAKLLGLAELHKVYVGNNYDPVLHTREITRGGLNPPCTTNSNICKWRKSIQSNYYKPRPTAYRIETICPSDRCGYMIKPSTLGGNFFDYATCLHPR